MNIRHTPASIAAPFGPYGVTRFCKGIGGSACRWNYAVPGIDRQKPVKTEQLLEQGSGLQKHRLAARGLPTSCRPTGGPYFADRVHGFDRSTSGAAAAPHNMASIAQHAYAGHARRVDLRDRPEAGRTSGASRSPHSRSADTRSH